MLPALKMEKCSSLSATNSNVISPSATDLDDVAQALSSPGTFAKTILRALPKKS
jgi:hypothetical protein